jgi:hypothetical protein
MSQELVLTVINESKRFESIRSEFATRLTTCGASNITVANYCAAIRRWLGVLAQNPGVRPALLWQRALLSSAMKRITGYACRRYTAFLEEVLGESIHPGIPSRLPAASRPNPRPISDSELQQLSIVAKKLFPPETSLSFRVWLQFTNETGCRRTEGDIDWDSVNWRRRSVVVRGKTGERELPLW